MVFPRALQEQNATPSHLENRSAEPAFSAPITLRIEDGLLMAFGPDGDPLSPAQIKRFRRDDMADQLWLADGSVVDRKRALAVLDAQQRGPLSETPDDRWIEAMLGVAGGFEPTSADLLDREPKGYMPTAPERLSQSR